MSTIGNQSQTQLEEDAKADNEGNDVDVIIPASSIEEESGILTAPSSLKREREDDDGPPGDDVALAPPDQQRMRIDGDVDNDVDDGEIGIQSEEDLQLPMPASIDQDESLPVVPTTSDIGEDGNGQDQQDVVEEQLLLPQPQSAADDNEENNGGSGITSTSVNGVVSTPAALAPVAVNGAQQSFVVGQQPNPAFMMPMVGFPAPGFMPHPFFMPTAATGQSPWQPPQFAPPESYPQQQQLQQQQQIVPPQPGQPKTDEPQQQEQKQQEMSQQNSPQQPQHQDGSQMPDPVDVLHPPSHVPQPTQLPQAVPQQPVAQTTDAASLQSPPPNLPNCNGGELSLTNTNGVNPDGSSAVQQQQQQQQQPQQLPIMTPFAMFSPGVMPPPFPPPPGMSESDAAAFAARSRMILGQFPSLPPGMIPPFMAAANGAAGIGGTQIVLQHTPGMMQPQQLPPPPPPSQFGEPTSFVMGQPQAQNNGVSLALSCDEEQLSEYQILVRRQLEIFEALQEDVESNTQGRKKQVNLGQVGIRCRHCSGFPLRQRGRGAVYYPHKLHGVYQAAQNMASSHLCESCQSIPADIKMELRTLRERRDTASGGKQYWADAARAMGLHECEVGLRLHRRGNL